MNLIEIKNEILNCFNGLHFDEELHQYTYNNKSMLSTTRYISKFSEKFDPYWPSEAKGKKNLKNNPDDRRDGAYYRCRWNYIRDEAAKKGSRVHLFAECYPDFDTPICDQEQGVMDFFDWLPDNYELLFSEFRLFDKELYLAGTIDGILLNKDTGNLVIIDWKTNTKNILEYYKSKKLKLDFKKLPATSLNKYSLQLSSYQHLLEKNTSYKVEDTWVIWLTTEGIYTKSRGKSDDYKINRIKPFQKDKRYAIFKTKDYSETMGKYLKQDVKDIQASATKAKFKFKPKEKSYKKSSLGDKLKSMINDDK